MDGLTCDFPFEFNDKNNYQCVRSDEQFRRFYPKIQFSREDASWCKVKGLNGGGFEFRVHECDETKDGCKLGTYSIFRDINFSMWNIISFEAYYGVHDPLLNDLRSSH